MTQGLRWRPHAEHIVKAIDLPELRRAMVTILARYA